MFEYFYHQVIRKVVVAFGTLFNNIHIARYDSDGNEVERIKVPLGYGPQQKFIRRLNRIGRDFEERNIKIENYLPRMSFEIQNIIYDTTRKLSPLNRTVSASSSSGSLRSRYERVPYTMELNLGIMAKNMEDALQILEQILPYFQPEYTVTVVLNDTDPQVDIPFVFKNTTIGEGDDGSYGNYDLRKVTYMNLNFTAKFYLYGPIRDSKIITNSTVNLFNFPSGTTFSTVQVVAVGATPGTKFPTGMTGSIRYATGDGNVGFTGPTGSAHGLSGIQTTITEY
jgi:hypothetical protein